MRLNLASPPPPVVVAAAAEFLRRGRSRRVRGRTLAGWHRHFLPRLGDRDRSDGALAQSGRVYPRLYFAGWCCLVLDDGRISARLSVCVAGQDGSARVTGIGDGDIVTKWVAAVAAAEAQPWVDPKLSFEPALLTVPDANACAALLLPQDEVTNAQVWPVIKRAYACSVGLQTLDAFLDDCKAAPRARVARGHHDKA